MGLIDIIGNHGGDMVILALVYGGLPITLGFVLLVLGLNLPRQQ